MLVRGKIRFTKRGFAWDFEITNQRDKRKLFSDRFASAGIKNSKNKKANNITVKGKSAYRFGIHTFEWFLIPFLAHFLAEVTMVAYIISEAGS